MVGITPDPEVLALIPARGGSRGLPRKNVRTLGGHPLIAWSIAAARQSASVTRVIVSSDDEEILHAAHRYGAETPFVRPAELAEDDTLDLPVFAHALHWLEEREAYRPEVIVQLRPTSPLRPHDLVDRVVESLLQDPTADSARTVTVPSQNPFKMWRIVSGHLAPLVPCDLREPYNLPRQALPLSYWQTGHVDATRPATIRQQCSMTGALILPVMVDPAYAIDIDSPEHLHQAEALLAEGRLDVPHPSRARRPGPGKVEMLVLDFDGVLTNNRVWVGENGEEMVACSRGDGLGIAALRAQGVNVAVLSSEASPVVAARCAKLGIPCIQDAKNKGPRLAKLALDAGVPLEHVIYVGNDVNDVPAMELAGLALAPSDAHAAARGAADRVLSRPGGGGAVREVCDWILTGKQSEGGQT